MEEISDMLLPVLQHKKVKITSDSEDEVGVAEEERVGKDEADDTKPEEETDQQEAAKDEGQPEEDTVVPDVSDSDSDSGLNKDRG
jgi:hypothetical protein